MNLESPRAHRPLENNLHTERPTFVDHLACSMTGARLPADTLHNRSAEGWPLLVHYDLEALGRAVTRDDLAHRAPDFWRYREFLPVRRCEDIVSLGELCTPLVPLPRLAQGWGELWVKDEGRLPTGSFKARGLALAVSMAKALGATELAMPTNGNAGAALAAYGTRAGLRTHIFCPSDTPPVNMAEIAYHGAQLHRVDGLIDACGKLVTEGVERDGWFSIATLHEPYRIEGKKTMGLELAEQLRWRPPGVIFYPTGGGTGLIGMWKVFAELETLGWLDGPKPRMVAVQAAGCAPMVKAFEAGEEHAERWTDAHTVAAGIRVPAALGDFLVLRAVRASGGFAIAVDDEAIEAARIDCARQEGMLLCPEGAATLAAYRQALAEGRVGPDESAVLFNCATGLKYPFPAEA